MKWIPTLTAAAILLASCTAPQAQPTAGVTQADVLVPTDTPQAYMPNPASVFCEQYGNRLEIRTAPDGSQSGACIFPNGSECDEWAYFRGECKPSSGRSSGGSAEVDSQGWNIYHDESLGFSFHYPADAVITSDDEPKNG